MVVDASALLAILLREPDWQVYEDRLLEAGGARMSPVNFWEVLARMARLNGDAGRDQAERLFAVYQIEITAVGPEMTRAAVTALDRFGAGPLRLNLGDTFAYALAKAEGDGLLYKGNDFARTDVINALTGKPGPA